MRARTYPLFAILTFFLLGPHPGECQVDLGYYLPMDVSYNPDIPTPESIFGFQVGEYHLRHDQLVDYMETLARASDRVALEDYGRTYEQRPLLLMTLTSARNLQNIDRIQQQHKALSDPERAPSAPVEDMPVVVWMGYSIHGDESSGSNAAPLVAYYLAAAEGPEIEALLNRTVILLDPCFNPDGLSRFAHWANMHRGNNRIADPNHREHRQVWPGGRTNHYWFDLNRDWLPLQHPESRGRVSRFHEWMPNLLTDHHEMGTNRTFFFQPGIPSRNNPLTPEKTYELTSAIAEYHAEALDRTGALYYTRESYDDFYIGKGSTYPDLNGGIGILFEQASSRGHVQETEHGLLHFPFTIRNQVTTSLSTLRGAKENRQALLDHQRTFYTSALQEAARSEIQAYIFGTPSDPARNTHFLDLLQRHQIRVYELARQMQVEGLTFRPGTSYVVPVNQPQYRLLTSLFERRTAFQDSLFYDVSAWTLPLAFNLPFAEFRSRSLPEGTLGRRIEKPAFPTGRLIGEKRPYAYAFEWKGYYAPRALYRLMVAGAKTYVATEPFEALTAAGKRAFDYGTILIPTGIPRASAASIDRWVETIAHEDGIQVFALDTGLTPTGIDLGSPSFQALSKPETLLMVGEGVSEYRAGEVWHLLDQRYDMEVSMVETGRIGRTRLGRYTCIVMADGSETAIDPIGPKPLYTAIDSTGLQSLTRWVKSGGTLVVMGNAARWAVEVGLANAKLKAIPRDSAATRKAYGSALRDRGAQVIGGAIFEAHLDRTHPLGYGYDASTVSVHRTGTLFMEPSEDPYATPLLYTRQPLLSGYISKKNAALLKGSAAILVSRLDAGRVILIMDALNFRAYWYGTNKLFINSLFFGSIIR